MRAIVGLLLLVAYAGQPAIAEIDARLLAGMQARSIGPAGMSGRVAAIDAVNADPNVIYVGAATGGVWKSINGGLTWKPIFDDERVAAIGSVAIFQPSPDIVWVGTGEGNPRNSVSVGRGIYRSLDGGRNWKHMGLEATERIHRIVTHPTNPDMVWVAAMGREWGENEQRGVYKTTDGGKSWNKVLYVDERTGAADLVLDPRNPRKLFAAMWDYRRWPWSFRSGGAGSGLHVSLDGGDSWKRLTPEDGLPEGDLGRIGLAIARSNPEIVYALIEAKKNGLYVSKDGGDSWEATGESRYAGNRPFYYGDIRVDPERPSTVYSLWSMISVSRDGGKDFEILVPYSKVHPDHHAMWINPADGRQIIAGNDGGVAITSDRGETWRFVTNLPLAQYYHIHVDMDTPYNVYGGMQDNGSWRGPSTVWENGGIRNHHWEEVGFGDGFDTLPDPRDSMMGYAMSQQGYLSRWDLRTGERKDIRPSDPPGTELRFNWNAGFAIDPFEPNVIYYGSQFVHRSAYRGESWEIVSGDLTSNNPEWQKQDESGGLTLDVTGAENFTTIVTIAPSAKEQGVIWVGTDDGRLHLSRDAGKSWDSIEERLRGVPEHTWIPHIEPSKFDGGTAFVVLDDHRRSNWTPYVYRTTDYGRTWKSLVTDDIDGYCLAIAQDPVDENLLFLGTEFGLFVSVDGGSSWSKYTHGFPTVATRDLIVHPREHDLVIGTHGRAAYVIDDIRPLRGLTAEILAEPLHLFEIPTAQQYRVKQTGASRFPGATEFRGDNRPYGALISYSLNVPGLPHPDDDAERARKQAERDSRSAESGGDEVVEVEEKKKDEPEVELEIRARDGEVIRHFSAPARLGINRVAWDLRRDAFDEPPTTGPRWFQPRGPQVIPGEYSVTLTYGDHVAEGTIRVFGDPRFSITLTDRQAREAAQLRAGAMQETVADAVRRIAEARSDVEVLLQKATHAGRDEDHPDDEERLREPYKSLVASGKELVKSLGDVEKKFWRPPATKGIGPRDHALTFISYAYRSLGSSWDSPTGAQYAYLKQAETMLAEAADAFNELFAGEVAEFRREVAESDLGLLPAGNPLVVP
jgi:photosystem II stability/assembly factor-like uncharacterized protein